MIGKQHRDAVVDIRKYCQKMKNKTINKYQTMMNKSQLRYFPGPPFPLPRYPLLLPWHIKAANPHPAPYILASKWGEDSTTGLWIHHNAPFEYYVNLDPQFHHIARQN